MGGKAVPGRKITHVAPFYPNISLFNSETYHVSLCADILHQHIKPFCVFVVVTLNLHYAESLSLFFSPGTRKHIILKI